MKIAFVFLSVLASTSAFAGNDLVQELGSFFNLNQSYTGVTQSHERYDNRKIPCQLAMVHTGNQLKLSIQTRSGFQTYTMSSGFDAYKRAGMGNGRGNTFTFKGETGENSVGWWMDAVSGDVSVTLNTEDGNTSFCHIEKALLKNSN